MNIISTSALHFDESIELPDELVQHAWTSYEPTQPHIHSKILIPYLRSCPEFCMFNRVHLFLGLNFENILLEGNILAILDMWT